MAEHLRRRITGRTAEGLLLRTVDYGGGTVDVVSKYVGRFNVTELLNDRDEFLATKANPQVDYLVDFGSTFKGLIGKYDGKYERWEDDPQRLLQNGIVVMEYFYDEAGSLLRRIDNHAQKAIGDNRYYDDSGWQQEYFDLAEDGYALLRTNQDYFNVGPVQLPIALERAGLVSVRLAMGLNMNDKIPQETRVVTKRVHVRGDEETNLAATVTWRDVSKLGSLNHQTIDVIDFVNPASGASTAAVILALDKRGIKPKTLVHRSISATVQGILFNRAALSAMGINPIFYTLGVAHSMNEHYYLNQPGRAVGDAGRALRKFQPDWINQQ